MKTTKITDWTAFEAFVEQHRHCTQAEMAEQWSGAISQRTISRALKRINWTRKKRPMATASEMRRNAKPSSLNGETTQKPLT